MSLETQRPDVTITPGSPTPMSLADGADVTQGAIADAAVTGDNPGTQSAKLRGINKILASVWDNTLGRLKVSVENTPSVTVSGAVTVSEPVSVDDNGGSLTVDGTVATTVADGANVALGTTTDPDTANTVIGRLKRIITLLSGTLTVAFSGTPTVNVSEPVSVDDNGGSLTVDAVDGGLASIGATTDAEATGNGSVIAILKRIRTLLGGTITVSISGTPTVNQGTSPWVIGDGGSSITVDGTVSVTEPVSVDDNGGSLTTDSVDGGHATIGTTTDAEATGNGTIIALLKRLRTLLAGGLPSALVGGRLDVNVGNTPTVNQGTSPWVVGDGGSSITVDGSVSITGTPTVNQGTSPWVVDQQSTAELDYDTGAGTVNQSVVGLALPGSGGPVPGGTAANPVRVDPTGTTAQPVTDNGGSLTTDSVDGGHATIGTTTDAESVSGNGTVIALLKRLRTLFGGGLPSALISGRLDVNVGNTPSVDVTPSSPAATDYLPVRLTDGTSFYNASGGGGGSSAPIYDQVSFGGTALTVKWAAIDINGATDHTLVAAVASKKITVIGIHFTCRNNQDVGFKSGSSVLVQPMLFKRGEGMNAWLRAGFVVQTDTNQALVMSLTRPERVRGLLQYVEV